MSLLSVPGSVLIKTTLTRSLAEALWCTQTMFLSKWKALKCQTLGAAVHVIVLVCWLETERGLWLSHACHRILFCSCPCKVRSRVSDDLSQALCNLCLAFLADFTLSDCTAPIRFVVKLFSLAHTLYFSFGSKDKITAFTSSVLQVQQLYTAGIPLLEAYCQWPIIELAKNVSPRTEWPTSNKVQSFLISDGPIHTHARFPRSKKWPTFHVAAVSTENTLALQWNIRENSLKFKFDLHPPLRLVSFVVGIIAWKVRCWVTDTHTHTDTHTDTQTKYCNPPCACAPRVNKYGQQSLADGVAQTIEVPGAYTRLRWFSTTSNTPWGKEASAHGWCFSWKICFHYRGRSNLAEEIGFS